MDKKELNVHFEHNNSNFLEKVAIKAKLNKEELTIIKHWLAEQLVSQKYAKLEQGGHTNSQVPLSNVFIDLPIKAHHSQQEERPLFLKNLFKSQPINLKNALKSNTDLHSMDLIENEDSNEEIFSNRSFHDNHNWGATLLIGGPGQGKSTLTQLACQFHRANLIYPYINELTSVQKETVNSFFTQDDSLNSLKPPKVALLPIQITLPNFAEWAARTDIQNNTSPLPLFIQFIEQLPSSKNIKLDASKLFQLMCVTPSIIILDGFDEVGAAQDRERIVQAVRELINILAENSASAQILATTRPQGYADEFSQIGLKLQKFFLAPLEKDEALTYANKLIQAKITGADLQAKAFRQISEAATEPSTERLLTTPLQVTILTALIQQLGRAPKERWNLFSRYFSYTFDREIERETYASSLLAEHRTHIERIHARVGLLLQVEAERYGGASARMSKTRLEEVISAVLTEDEISIDQQKELIREIANAAENRLVFLVEPEPGKFGFEIRSLQEFMAAWALCSGRDSEVETRLIQISKSPMFRNVLLFVSSKLFSESSPLRDILADHICKYLDDDNSDELARASKAGSRLALEILEEGSALAQPKRARALVNRAVGLLELPADYEHIRLLRIVNEETKPILIEAIEKHLIVSAKKNYGENNAVWACIIESTNKNETWAINIGNEYFNTKVLTEDLFYFLNISGISLGEWICNKIEEYSHEIDPEIFINTSKLFPGKFKKDIKWTNWLKYIFFIVEENPNRDRFDVLKIDNNKSYFQKIPSPSYELPKSKKWETWYLVANFEKEPTLDNLIILLEKIEENKSLDYWKKQKIRFSWPFLATISYVNNIIELKKVIIKLKAKELGNEIDWINAQHAWSGPQDIDNIIKSINLSLNLPWTLKSINLYPPILTTNLSNLSYFINSNLKVKNKEEIIETSSLLINKTKSALLKEALSVICLSFWRKLPLKSQKIYNENHLETWVSNNFSYQTIILKRPKSLSLIKWSELLNKVTLKKQDLLLLDPLETLFSSLIELPKHPTLIYFTINLLYRYQNHIDYINAIPQTYKLKEIIKKIDPDEFNENLTKANFILIQIVLGQYQIERNQDFLSIIFKAYESEPRILLNTIILLKMVSTSQKNNELVLIEIYNFIFNKNSLYKRPLLQEIKEQFQKRTSGLELTTNWNKLSLPFPVPQQSKEQIILGGIPENPIHIKSIKVEGIGAISDLTLEFINPEKDHGQWIVIIGPNGSGKTTLLKSFVISLRNIKNPSIWPRGVFGNYWRKVTKEQNNDFINSNITITLSDTSEHQIHIRPNNTYGLDFIQIPEQEKPQLFPIFAYGCRRGSALGGASRQVNLDENDGPEIATLFDESADLIQAETWLISLEGDISKNPTSKLIFENTLDSLKKLMNLKSIEVFDQKLWFSEDDNIKIPFSCLSDGYLTNAGWFLDLVARWLKYAEQYNFKIDKNFLNNMTGLVIIDEIDLHLHPEWQIEIISRTKKILPKMSFIVSTHNPLTLVGAKSEEIWTLNRNEERITASQGVETPMLLTSGQIYRQYFGIKDIYPNHLGRLLKRFSHLSSFSLRDDNEEAELIRINEELSEAGIETGWEITPRVIG
ncbi:AAA family ATPase [Acinetobacter proteolyticus]|uniref:AAA family ATPase n=1 Tax=Acinetobacter proteolyticus TaxID=1776741 RepID=UPI003D996D10